MDEIPEKPKWRWSNLPKRRQGLLIGSLLALAGIIAAVVIYANERHDLAASGFEQQRAPMALSASAPREAPQSVEIPTRVTPASSVPFSEPGTETAPLPAPVPQKVAAKKVRSLSPVVKTSTDDFVWKHFGASPYAKTRAEAMRTREDAFRRLGFSRDIARALAQAVAKPGERIVIQNGDRLQRMISGGSAIHQNVVVAFDPPKENPKMQFAAPAERWRVVVNGTTYTIILPDVCNNWSVPAEVIPPTRTNARIEPASPRCYEIAFNAPIGASVRWGTATYRGPFPPDACNAQRQGELPWVAWYGKCDDCIIPYEKMGVSVPHKFLYEAVRREQVLRFPAEVLTSVVYLCVGEFACGIYVRPEDWKGRTRIEISPEMLASQDCR